MPAVAEHSTAKYYVDNDITGSVYESSLVGLDPKEELKINEQNSSVLNSTLTSPKTIIKHLPKIMLTAYLKLMEIDLSTVFNDRDKNFDKNNLTNLESISVNQNPILVEELSKKVW